MDNKLIWPLKRVASFWLDWLYLKSRMIFLSSHGYQQVQYDYAHSHGKNGAFKCLIQYYCPGFLAWGKWILKCSFESVPWFEFRIVPWLPVGTQNDCLEFLQNLSADCSWPLLSPLWPPLVSAQWYKAQPSSTVCQVTVSPLRKQCMANTSLITVQLLNSPSVRLVFLHIDVVIKTITCS